MTDCYNPLPCLVKHDTVDRSQVTQHCTVLEGVGEEEEGEMILALHNTLRHATHLFESLVEVGTCESRWGKTRHDCTRVQQLT